MRSALRRFEIDFMYALVFALLWKRFGALLVAGAVAGMVAGALVWLAGEFRTGRMQAALISTFVRELRFQVEPGASDAIRFPSAGPYDERLGYRRLPRFAERLEAQGFAVTAQARMSPRLLAVSDSGLFAPYREKGYAGLELRDCRGESISAARYPQRIYERFEAVPPLLVNALLFIENRSLLDPQSPMLNPAIDWSRLTRAAVDQALRAIDDAHPAGGGSTLATQIEKYRHSPNGRTDSVTEKLRQIASASLRAYLDGENTLPWRRRIVVDYLNTVPLAARNGFGEVNGIGDGLWVWYGRDFVEFNRVLADTGDAPHEPLSALQRQALAFKQALSLLVAQRRPTHHLGSGAPALGELTNAYLRVMGAAGVISPTLRDAALPLPLQFASASAPAHRGSTFVERKAATALRTRLASLLDVPQAYDLERLDLAVASTLDGRMQRSATRALHELKTRQAARAAGLIGRHLVGDADDPGKLVFSLTLYERGEHANWLRVQTDNFDQPFDVNDGARLDLGSTAKLRALITYLEIVAEAHARWHALGADDLAALRVHPKDSLGRWVRTYLSTTADRSLGALLEAALERRYSANPAEAFYTGGGLHRFVNFEPEHNGRTMSVREGLTHSVNLVFIRLMRDVVHHYTYRDGGPGTLLDDPADPRRQEVLAQFADREGREYLARFYRQYRGKSQEEALDLLLRDVRATPPRLAGVFGMLEPAAGPDALAAFLARRLPQGVTARSAAELHGKYHGAHLSLADRGYLVGVHPLELWLAGFLRQQPGATLDEVIAASGEQRQAAYGWLFRTRHRQAQDQRIRSLVEIEAFREIQRAWRRLGYPFESLTPSYATAIGASGDRPAALAELMGIIANRGLRLPAVRITALEFARDTPYETRLGSKPPSAERVLPEAVADAVRRALVGVVEEGTARRLKGAFVRRDGGRVEIGGKTGTGDHRFEVHGRGGRLVSSRVVNRSATFAFLLGERHFGTVMVFVGEPHAAKYRFTSALPAQLLKSLAPALMPSLEHETCTAGSGG
jgi:membrane peptidoglycan carboxypeptidase